MSTGKIIGYILAAILLLFGVLWLLSAFSAETSSPIAPDRSSPQRVASVMPVNTKNTERCLVGPTEYTPARRIMSKSSSTMNQERSTGTIGATTIKAIKVTRSEALRGTLRTRWNIRIGAMLQAVPPVR